jgi:hypothetical protein
MSDDEPDERRERPLSREIPMRRVSREVFEAELVAIRNVAALAGQSFWIARALDALGQRMDDMRDETRTGLADLRADIGRHVDALRADVGELRDDVRAFAG